MKSIKYWLNIAKILMENTKLGPFWTLPGRDNFKILFNFSFSMTVVSLGLATYKLSEITIQLILHTSSYKNRPRSKWNPIKNVV